MILAIINLTPLGAFGLDRLILGSYITAVLKFLTGGGVGIWAVIDWILIVSNGLFGAESINIFFMSATFDPSSIGGSKIISIIDVCLVLGLPALLACCCGTACVTGCLAAIPFWGRFFKTEEPQHAPLTGSEMTGKPPNQE